MSISLNANFELLSAGLYLDARQQFNTLIEMKDFAETSIPDGFITYNKETQKHYVFSSSNTADVTLGKWREYNSGDSSSTTYATWDSNVDYKVGNVVLKDDVRYSCIADHTSTDFETDSINWVVVLEQYYHVTQEQYNKMVSDGLITDGTKDLYIIDGNSEGGNSLTKDTLSLVSNSQFFTISITKNNANWYGNLKLSYMYGTSPAEVDITITDTLSYTVSKGTNTISNITYTVDGANITIGINCDYVMYGTQTVEMPSEFGIINSLTAEEFTGANTATLRGFDGGRTYVTLSELRLTAPITVGEIFNAMPDNTMAVLACDDITNHITDVPTSFGVLTIKRNGNGRFSIDYQTSLASSPCNVKRWIGTLKGVDGTGLYWKEVAYKDNIAIYRSLSELGVDTTATLRDITRAMVNNSIIAIKVDAMADQSEYNSISLGTVTIYKIEDARIQAIMTEKSTGRTWVGILGGENSIIGWKEITTNITTTINNSSTTSQVPSANTMASELYGGNLPSTGVNVLELGAGVWKVDSNAKASACTNMPIARAGKLFVYHLHGNDGLTPYTGSFKYAMYKYMTIDGDEYVRTLNSDGTVGNIVNDTGWRKIQTSGDKATLVSNTPTLKLDVTKKNANWYGNLKLSYMYGTSPAEVDITITGTLSYTVTKGTNTISSITYTTNGANITIGIKFTGTMYGTQTVEMPSEFGIINSLTAEEFTGANTATSKGYDVLANAYSTTEKARVTTLESQVSELFQSVSDGKTLVANAITGKGVSTSTSATFATMATNIGKIPQTITWQEETVTGTRDADTRISTFVFSNTVLGIKQITAPGYNYTTESTELKMFTINGNTVKVKTESGTWKMTALVRVSS